MSAVSLNQISQNILNLLTGGRTTNNELYSLEQIKFQVKYYRALLIRRDVERGLTHLEHFEQDLGHIDLIDVDSAELQGLYSGNIIKKSVKQLPSALRLRTKKAITYVAPYGRAEMNIPFIEPVRSAWQSFNKFTSESPFSFIKNDYLYIVNATPFSKVYVRGVFEDPEHVFEFTEETGLELYDSDSPFPISEDLLQQVTQSILNGEGTAVLQTTDPEEPNFDS